MHSFLLVITIIGICGPLTSVDALFFSCVVEKGHVFFLFLLGANCMCVCHVLKLVTAISVSRRETKHLRDVHSLLKWDMAAIGIDRGNEVQRVPWKHSVIHSHISWTSNVYYGFPNTSRFINKGCISHGHGSSDPLRGCRFFCVGRRKKGG